MDKYPALKFIVNASNVLAYGIAGVIILLGLIYLFGKGGFGFFVLSLVVAGFTWLGIKSYSELIQVFIQIEKNTR